MLSRLTITLLLGWLAFAANAQPILNPPGPKVLVDTSLGSFTIELYPTSSPVTVNNFLRYVRTGYYNGLIFHQAIPGLLVQGGGYTQKFQRRDTFAPIRNESSNGLKNLRGTVAMARLKAPDSATSEFLINLVDNPEFDYADGKPGSAVFGRVVHGMDVVDEIARQPQGRRRGQFSNAPNRNVVIRGVRILENEGAQPVSAAADAASADN